MLNVWTKSSVYDFSDIIPSEQNGKLDERRSVNLALPTITDLTGISFSVISGALPGGLRLENNRIIGTTLEVPTTTTFKFVIRASNGLEVNDRTFSLAVAGPDAPQWVTPEGALAVGTSTTRIANIQSFSRTNNLITIQTAQAHTFVFGNIISVYCTNPIINGVDIEILRPNPNLGETEEEYNTRIANTITYRKVGPNIAQTTASGNLVLNNSPLTFVLDNTYIDFQLQAIDTDLSANDNLEFFIAEGEGELPPGLTLSSTGRISGIIDPILALDITARTGFFDTNLFDSNPYDFGEVPNIGIEDYYNVLTPKKLNRNYEFIASVTDGETIVKRIFRIFVVGDDFLRADNMLMPVGTSAFTADATYLRAIVWLSANNLGLKRANNYVTILLDTFDPNPAIGPVEFVLEAYNDDLSVSKLPDGLFLDPKTGEIFGFIPYQPAITENFKFTINARKYDKENLQKVDVQIIVADDAAYGQNYLMIWPLDAESQNLITGDVIRIGPTVYTITEYIAPVGSATKAMIRLSDNLITDVFDTYTITQTYYISGAYIIQDSKKTFTVSVLGEVDSVIKFNTPSDLGVIKVNYPSRLSIDATTSVPEAILTYRVVEGSLPPGLSLSSAGNIVGKINQFRADSVSGFTTFDNAGGNPTTFDGGSMTIDQGYRFTVYVQDQFRFSATSQEFILRVNGTDLTLYSNIYTKPLPRQEKRDLFYNFINDTTVFTPNKIYRFGDPEYGVQTELKMLIYPGIESLEISNYIAAISKNTKRKRMKLGNVKKAIAKEQGSDTIVYEVIYVEALDDYENANGSVAAKVKLPQASSSPISINQARRNPVDGKIGTVNQTTNPDTITYESSSINSKMNSPAYDRFVPTTTPITIDSSNVNVSGRDLEYVYPSSIKNIRSNIQELGITENSFLPLWMTTPQDNRTAATGFINAIPLCYCKPGEGDYILANIKNRNFDFSQLDYEIDRFIIDSDINDVQEKYLKFANYRFNI